MKPLDELRAAFSGAGVKLDTPIVTSCGSGVSAAVLTLALYRLGVENPALYDGSWTEWGAADGPPVATGPGLISTASRVRPVIARTGWRIAAVEPAPPPAPDAPAARQSAAVPGPALRPAV